MQAGLYNRRGNKLHQSLFGFQFLVSYAATLLTLPLHQELNAYKLCEIMGWPGSAWPTGTPAIKPESHAHSERQTQQKYNKTHVHKHRNIQEYNTEHDTIKTKEGVFEIVINLVLYLILVDLFHFDFSLQAQSGFLKLKIFGFWFVMPPQRFPPKLAQTGSKELAQIEQSN